MAENTTKMIDQFLDADGKPLPLSGAAVMDKATGQTFAQHMADSGSHPTQASIQQLINDALTPIQTTLNTFLTGDPDDNGTVDRLKELVAAIVENKENIDAILAINNSGTGIAFVDSAEATPEYNGKIRMVVSEYAAENPEPAE